jgi:competence protein ComEA
LALAANRPPTSNDNGESDDQETDACHRHAGGVDGFAFAQVDVNKADAAALDGVKGIGPSMSKVILDERSKGGPFKDWADFQKRVKGVGDKRAAKLSEAGLQVNGKAKPGAAAEA